MCEKKGILKGPDKLEILGLVRIVLSVLFCVSLLIGCGEIPAKTKDIKLVNSSRTPRLALWLAKKNELLQQDSADYDLIMTAWFEKFTSFYDYIIRFLLLLYAFLKFLKLAKSNKAALILLKNIYM